jgi:hypothetical protein
VRLMADYEIDSTRPEIVELLGFRGAQNGVSSNKKIVRRWVALGH